MIRLSTVPFLLVTATKLLSTCTFAFTTPISSHLSIKPSNHLFGTTLQTSRSRFRRLLSMSDAIIESDPDPIDSGTENGIVDEIIANVDPSEVEVPLRKLGKLKKFLGLGPKQNEESQLSFRQKLAKAGLTVALSYGAVSNATYGVSMSLAWYGFSRKTGLSPLEPNQWKSFLTVYSAFFIFNNIVRPFRFAASVAVAPYFERLIQLVQSKLRLPRAASIGLCVFLVNIVGTLSLMTLGISIASTLAGVPAIPMRR